ncbi:GTP pyrophosphokinase family protein [Lentilactobacillus sp. Marseille-Q4993]|uniref:GTP pyrophosphokinase n=1 Tax=Lentilactobacillus sp. Marseille-Q4993 TaxID=3039492 RepID=UPI0024BCD396|nr:GTP pyrophosphokinase family protein [Lentilactobacillus sp. Marseille-Q4993]
MIIERQNMFNIKRIEKQIKDSPMAKQLDSLKQISELYLLRKAALNEIGTKLENLDAEYNVNFDHNPIHHMEERLKEPSSLLEKLSRKGYGLSLESITKNIYDVAGIRVITNYVSDIFKVQEALLKQDDVTLIKQKDYVSHPKSNGYRSLHLIVSVPVFLDEGVHETPVEIQVRTMAMDTWASLEHELSYKSFADDSEAKKYSQNLKEYSDQLFGIETNMQKIFDRLQEK